MRSPSARLPRPYKNPASPLGCRTLSPLSFSLSPPLFSLATPSSFLAANGFFRRSLHKREAQALHGAWYPCPPDMRVGHNHTLGVSDVPIPDAPPQSEASWAVEVHALFYNGLTDEQRASPLWDPYNPANVERYDAVFRRRHREEFNRWDDPGPVSRDRNVVERRAFWSVSGRTLQTVIAHIEAGARSRVETPAAPPAPTNRWAARRGTTQVTSSSSSCSSSSLSSRSAPPARQVYDNGGASSSTTRDARSALPRAARRSRRWRRRRRLSKNSGGSRGRKAPPMPTRWRSPSPWIIVASGGGVPELCTFASVMWQI